LPLVEYDEAREFLDLKDEVDEKLIGDLLDGVTAVFEAECGRAKVPYGKAQLGRAEVHPARPGSWELKLDYGIAAVSSIGLGVDPESPTETINPATPGVVRFTVGDRILYRIDGGTWDAGSPILSWARGGPLVPGPRPGLEWGPRQPGWVKLVYNTTADLPLTAQMAVKRVTAAIYRQRHKEGFSSKSGGDLTEVIQEVASKDDIWKLAVKAEKRLWAA
jgi:hypothetical protein